MKKQLITIAVALLTAGSLTTSCSNEDNAINTTPQTQLPDDETIDTSPQPQQPAANTITLTATLAPKGDDGGQTRAITPGTDDVTGEEILNMTWAAGEEIALYYQTATGYAKAMAIVQSVDATTGTATIEASLNANTTNGGTVKFVYPASLANDTGDDIDETKLLSQNGNLTGANGISTKFDAATGEGRINLNGGTTMPTTATVTNTAGTGNVSLIDRVCICKFHFDILESAGLSGPERNFSPIIIRDGNSHTYTITSDKDDGTGGTRGFKRSDDIYIALLPVSGKTVSFYTKYSNYYLYTASNTTLTAGKFYRNLSVDMVKDANTSALPYKDLTKGSITANDGDIIYMSSSVATANTITIPDAATITIENVSINTDSSAGIICEGDATINIEGANTVTTTAQNPAIQPSTGEKTLTIQGFGSLNATCTQSCAGIGSSWKGTCGNITINGGNITAIGGFYSAGIGCSWIGTCGNITINGGKITAFGGDWAAGIGSGGNHEDVPSVCGNITISGGSVTATGGGYGAGIGSGKHGKYGNITIGDGITNVTSTGGYQVPPIGKGADDKGSGTINIDGSTSWTAGTATEHLNWDTSTVKDDQNRDVTRWTLTHK